MPELMGYKFFDIWPADVWNDRKLQVIGYIYKILQFTSNSWSTSFDVNLKVFS